MKTARALAEAPVIDILLIEDNEGDVVLIQEMLEKTSARGFSISHASTLEMAEPEYRSRAFSILLLDLNLPGLSGMAAVEKVLQDLPTTPVIVMTGLDDEEKSLSAMQRGAQDYIVKGQYGNNVLQRAIRYAIERKRFENKVIELVHFDQVTGLMNRNVFLDQLENTMNLAARENTPVAILLLGLRRFKEVTATLGHQAGNQLLRAVAQRLKEYIPQSGAIARLDGNEFILLVTGQLAEPEHLADFSRHILGAIERVFDVGGGFVNIGGSIGVATYPGCGKNATELIEHADIALHRAKQDHNSRFQFYTATLNDELSIRLVLEKELQIALEKEELLAWYQPIIDLKNNRVCGVETLIRWHHPEKGFIPPATFIPLAEKSELILKIDEYVMKLACRDFMTLKNRVKQPFYVAVNLSTRDFQKKDFIERLNAIVDAAHMNPHDIALEITEGTLMENPLQSIATLKQCRASGLSIFIDDFGTGYSSLSYLSTLPLDILKIDRSFVADIMTNGHNLLIATATITLAHALGLQVVAEGIETKEQKELLAILGCDKVQGYYFAKPMPIEELTEWLARRHELTE